MILFEKYVIYYVNYNKNIVGNYYNAVTFMHFHFLLYEN